MTRPGPKGVGEGRRVRNEPIFTPNVYFLDTYEKARKKCISGRNLGAKQGEKGKKAENRGKSYFSSVNVINQSEYSF